MVASKRRDKKTTCSLVVPLRFAMGTKLVQIYCFCLGGQVCESVERFWLALAYKICREILLRMGIDPKRSLKNRFPEIAKQWHPTKNDPLTPDAVSFGSKQRVWWQCSKNPHHEWKAVIGNRSKGSVCPECVGKKPKKD